MLLVSPCVLFLPQLGSRLAQVSRVIALGVQSAEWCSPRDPGQRLQLATTKVATALVAYACWWRIEAGDDVLPFIAVIGLFLFGFLGLVVSNFPYLVPPSLTIWQLASAPATQVFTLIGTLVMLPIIVGYTIFAYWTFSGRVREGEGYH